MKEEKHLDVICNGLGAQSMVMWLKAARGVIPADVSITADTGWEFDRTWSNGRRGSAEEYFNEVVQPLAKTYGLDSRFVKAKNRDGVDLPGLLEYTRQVAKSGKFHGLNIPMFGSKGGRVTQRCTDKMKIRAVNQELRRMGATRATKFQGIHLGEADRRVKGIFLRNAGPWSIYQTVTEEMQKQPDGSRKKVQIQIKWLNHCYPLVDLKMNREACAKSILAENIPYLVSSECDGCPHKDLPRWERTDPGVLRELAELEAMFKGQFFFTAECVPLMEALEIMKARRAKNPEKPTALDDFGCGNAECGV